MLRIVYSSVNWVYDVYRWIMYGSAGHIGTIDNNLRLDLLPFNYVLCEDDEDGDVYVSMAGTFPFVKLGMKRYSIIDSIDTVYEYYHVSENLDINKTDILMISDEMEDGSNVILIDKESYIPEIMQAEIVWGELRVDVTNTFELAFPSIVNGKLSLYEILPVFERLHEIRYLDWDEATLEVILIDDFQVKTFTKRDTICI